MTTKKFKCDAVHKETQTLQYLLAYSTSWQLSILERQEGKNKIFTGLFCVVILHLLEIIGVMFISLDLLKSQRESLVYRRQKIEQCLLDYECLHGAIWFI